VIKAVIFDCFGVLTTEGFGLFRDKYLAHDPDKRHQANDSMDRLNSGQIPYDEFVKELAELADINKPVAEKYLSENKPNEPLFGYIRQNLKPHYKIGMLSNAGDDWLEEMFEQSDIKLFDDIVLSYKFGMIKPQPDIYALAAKRLGLTPGECVFIDDQIKHCEGARAVGMPAIIYKDLEQMKTELEKALAGGSNN
jgi:putative hydrolase of the HAD superfamily